MSAIANEEPLATVELSADKARALTDQIKAGMERIWDLVSRAYCGRAWAALGYESWDDYLDGEFGSVRLQLPREDRTEVVSSMRASGMSIRAIASGTGLSRGTVQRQLSGVPNGTPEDDLDVTGDGDAMEIPGGVTADTPGQTPRVEAILERLQGKAQPTATGIDGDPSPITGIDGKKYQSSPPTRKSPRSSILKDAAKISRELRRVFNRLEKLVGDDRFGRNQEAIRCEFGPHLKADIELLQRLRPAAGET
jgi:hypothetical protein